MSTATDGKKPHLAEVARCCEQKGYFLAVSRPYFEIWLLLHVDDPEPEILAGLNCDQIGTRIRSILGAYNKSNPDVDAFLPHVRTAIDRGRMLDIHPDDRWPQQPGTRVYLLAGKIVAQ